MSIYSDIPLYWWEYVLAIIVCAALMWLTLRATRKAERRREAALRLRDGAQQAAGDRAKPTLRATTTKDAR